MKHEVHMWALQALSNFKTSWVSPWSRMEHVKCNIHEKFMMDLWLQEEDRQKLTFQAVLAFASYLWL